MPDKNRLAYINHLRRFFSPRVVQKLNDAIKLAAQLDDQEPETKTTSKVRRFQIYDRACKRAYVWASNQVDGDKDTDPENAISEDEDQVTEDAAADNALVQSLVQDFARGAAAKASTLTKAERDQQNVERVRQWFHIFYVNLIENLLIDCFI